METSAFTWSTESWKDHYFHTNNEEKPNNLQNHKFSWVQKETWIHKATIHKNKIPKSDKPHQRERVPHIW